MKSVCTNLTIFVYRVRQVKKFGVVLVTEEANHVLERRVFDESEVPSDIEPHLQRKFARERDSG